MISNIFGLWLQKALIEHGEDCLTPACVYGRNSRYAEAFWPGACQASPWRRHEGTFMMWRALKALGLSDASCSKNRGRVRPRPAPAAITGNVRTVHALNIGCARPVLEKSHDGHVPHKHTIKEEAPMKVIHQTMHPWPSILFTGE
jgi:bifunctional pyridoxal-dependent enzyme with beta-cystathionase and maltose regulon repressor activities